MQTRRANFHDLLEMQHCNLRCLPENYNLRYYLYHYLSWPELLHVTHDYNNQVCGYVLSKLDDEEEEDKCHGHVTSLAVLRTQRKLGIASRVMNKALENMEEMTDSSCCSLHVRRTNEAALHLYQNTLGYRCAEVDEGYYVDGEDAFHMKKYLGGRQQRGSIVNEDGTLTKIPFNQKEDDMFLTKKMKRELIAAGKPVPTAAEHAAAVAAATKKNEKAKPVNAKEAAAAAAAAAAAILAELGESSGKGSKKGGKKK